MDTDTRQFATRFTDALSNAPGVQLWLLGPLLALLADGEPITFGQLATAAGRTTEEIRQALAAMPDTEYDAGGRVLGHGITLNPTPHRYETGGHTLYTWCALDTLAFPAILGRPARVTSPCHGTGEPVRLTVEPDRIVSVQPATAVVSLLTPDTPESVRTAFCHQIHFFAGPEAAQDWLDEHPGARVLPVADAYEVAGLLVDRVLAGGTASGCC